MEVFIWIDNGGTSFEIYKDESIFKKSLKDITVSVLEEREGEDLDMVTKGGLLKYIRDSSAKIGNEILTSTKKHGTLYALKLMLPAWYTSKDDIYLVLQYSDSYTVVELLSTDEIVKRFEAEELEAIEKQDGYGHLVKFDDKCIGKTWNIGAADEKYKMPESEFKFKRFQEIINHLSLVVGDYDSLEQMEQDDAPFTKEDVKKMVAELTELAKHIQVSQASKSSE